MRQTRKSKPAPEVEVVILAGGASSRLGRDKARARLGGRTLLQHSRTAAAATGWPVRVLRRDAVPKCGPLGGVLTALLQRGLRTAHRGTETPRRAPAVNTSRDVLVFLSCDLPFVSAAMIRRIAGAVTARRSAAFFVDGDGRAGFPFALRRAAQAVVERQIARGEFSLQALARATKAHRLRIPPRTAWRWFNINTPADLAQARHWAAKFAAARTKRRLSARRKAVSSRP